MENSNEITTNIISTINAIFTNLFSSIDNSLYEILDNLVFIKQDILKDNYFERIFGTSSSNGILLISNSLLIGFLLYYAVKLIMGNYTVEKIESPPQFIFKCIIYGICMNGSFFIIEQILQLNIGICDLISGLGEDLFGKSICFKELISIINKNLNMDKNIDIFTLDGLIKGTLTISLLNLVFTYALRYVLIKILIILSPFAFLSLTLANTSYFFKTWYKSLISLIFIQIIVSIILLLLFSMDYSNKNLLNKFIYLGGIYALIRANSISREIFGGISTTVQSGFNGIKLKCG